MSASEPQTIPFDGVRLRFGSTKSFDDLVDAVLADVGHEPVLIDDIAKQFSSWDSYESEVQSHVGPSGFMLFAALDHGGWIAKAGIQRKVLRLIIGNPLIAITMLRHDVTAGLFAPVELLLTEEEDGTSCADLRRAVVTHGRRTQPAASVGGARTRRQAGRAGHQGDRGLNQFANSAAIRPAGEASRREARLEAPARRARRRGMRSLATSSAVSSTNWVTVTGTSLPATARNSSQLPRENVRRRCHRHPPGVQPGDAPEGRRSPATDIQGGYGFVTGFGQQ